jgi:hypothetical protein
MTKGSYAILLRRAVGAAILVNSAGRRSAWVRDSGRDVLTCNFLPCREREWIVGGKTEVVRLPNNLSVNALKCVGGLEEFEGISLPAGGMVEGALEIGELGAEGLLFLKEVAVVVDSRREGYLIFRLESFVDPGLESLFWREETSLALGVLVRVQ